MPGGSHAGEIGRTERLVLSLLCQDSVARERLARILRDYRWRDLAHRVVFEIISTSRQLPAERLRALLPARLTTAGFPDFPWEDLFQPCYVSKEEAETLVQRLEASED